MKTTLKDRLANFIRQRKSTSPGTLVYFLDVTGQVRWHLRAANGEIVLPGEGHARVSDCTRAISAGIALLNDPNLEILDLTKQHELQKPPK